MFTIGTFILAGWILIVLLGTRNVASAHKILLYSWVVVSLYLNSGYFFSSGAFTLNFDEVLLTVSIALGFLAGIPRLYAHRYLVLSSILVVAVTFSIALVAWHPIDFPVMPVSGSWDRLAYGIDERVIPSIGMDHWQRLLRIIMFVLVYAQLEWFLFTDRGERDRLRQIIVVGAVVSAVVALLELLSWRLLGTDLVLPVVRAIFGNAASQVVNAETVAGGIRLQAFMKEPSNLAASLLPALVLLTGQRATQQRARYVTLFLLLSVVILSSTLTGVLVLAFVAAVWLWESSSARSLLLVLASAIMMGLVVAWIKPGLVEYWTQRILAAIRFAVGGVSTGQVTSEVVRLGSILNGMAWFEARPWFGIGLGSGVVHGALPNILSNTGVAGFLAWLGFLIRGNRPGRITSWLPVTVYLMVFANIGDISYMYSAYVVVMFLTVFRVPVGAPPEAAVETAVTLS